VDRDREAADPVLAFGVDEVGEAHVGPALALLHLLAQHRHPGLVVSGKDEDVVALAAAAPQADRAADRQPMLGDRSGRASPGRRRTGWSALADDRVGRGWRDNCRPAPRRGRRASSRSSRAIPERPVAEAGARRAAAAAAPCRPGRRGRRWRGPRRAWRAASGRGRRGSPGSGVSSATCAIRGSRWVSETSDEATPTARLASSTWITGPS
jgi:hypothetical protein